MNIKISKNAHSCAACGNDFQHEQEVTSTVKVAEGVLHREDFCRDCWKSEQNKETYSVWSMIFHDPKIENQEPAEVFSPLRQLFYEAAEEQSRIEMAKAFLAAGLLRRQKVFRLIKESDESDGDVRITLYTDRIGNRLIEVPDPQFTYAEMDKARTLLIERLQVLEQAAAAPAAESQDTAKAATETTAGSEDIDSTSPDLENEGEGENVQEAGAAEAMGEVDADAEDGEDDEFEDDEEEYDDNDDDDDDEEEDEDEEYEDDDDEDEDEDEYDDDDDDEEGDDDDEEYEDDESDDDDEDKEPEVKVMESALAGRGSTGVYAPGYVAFANEEARHAQA